MLVFDIYDDKMPRRIKIDADHVTIGRTADNDIIIHEKCASRQHCQVRLESSGDYMLHDLRSRNGTSINQKRIDQPSPLNNGDEINVGKSALRFWSSPENIDKSAPKLPLIVRDSTSKTAEDSRV